MIHPLTVLKNEQKELALKIRETKNTIKTSAGSTQSDAQSRLHSLQWDYRCKHIAYCELRGRNREQIENKSRINDPEQWYLKKELNRRVETIKEEYNRLIVEHNAKREVAYAV